MFKIKVIDNISPVGLERFNKDYYQVSDSVSDPDAMIVRSSSLHEIELPHSLKAIARAGAGVNNIPIDQLSEKGIPVFNTPGANANAVKELVIAGLLLASRNICQGWNYARQLTGDDQTISLEVEKGKKQFIGFELPGKTLGIIGLGAVGVKVANAAIALGMNVIGYDPSITLQRAWELSSNVKRANHLQDIFKLSDFISLHIPLIDKTKNMISSSEFQAMKDDTVLLNFSRAGIIDHQSLFSALETDKLRAFVCDFPTRQLNEHPKVIALPHLGASTKEATENCAVMAVDQIRDYLEQGQIQNSVNLPGVLLPRTSGFRIGIVNANIPNMVGQVSTILGEQGQNIVDMINKSRGDLAYTLLDVEHEVTDGCLNEIRKIEGILSARRIV